MDTRNLLTMILWLGMAAMGHTQQSPYLKKPNVVVFLSDDFGYDDLGSIGHPFVKTSNLDKLTETDVKRTNFYSAVSVCPPSPVAMRHGDYKILARLISNGVTLPMIANLYRGNEAVVKEAEQVDFEPYNLKKDQIDTANLGSKNPVVFVEMKTLLL